MTETPENPGHKKGLKPYAPLGIAIVSQIIPAVLIFLALNYLSSIDYKSQLYVVLSVQGAASASLGYFLGLPKWWIPVHLVLPVALSGVLSFALPSWVFLVVFVGLVLVFWNSAGDRVPLYLTNKTTWSAIEKQLPPGDKGRFIDLGCGVGGLLKHLADAKTGYQIEGIESAPLPYLISRIRLALLPHLDVTIRYGSLWNVDLSTYDVVYCFLSPTPMPKLYEKVIGEMKSGSLFISNSFDVPGHPADDIIQLDDTRQTCLHIWRV